jgi:hypothetical protein
MGGNSIMEGVEIGNEIWVWAGIIEMEICDPIGATGDKFRKVGAWIRTGMIAHGFLNITGHAGRGKIFR